MTINVKLGDKKSINKAIREIKKYQKTLNDRVNNFLTRVGELGINIANTYISQYSIPSEVIGQVKLEKGDVIVNGNTIQIIVTNDEALFWEYGTGLVGKDNPHIDPSGWNYNVKNYKKGWVYKGSATEYSWDFKDTGLQFTKGMPSQPFMFSTYEQLQRSFTEILNIAKEVFR